MVDEYHDDIKWVSWWYFYVKRVTTSDIWVSREYLWFFFLKSDILVFSIFDFGLSPFKRYYNRTIQIYFYLNLKY